MKRFILIIVTILCLSGISDLRAARYQISPAEEIMKLDPSQWRSYCLNSDAWIYNFSSNGFPAYRFTFESPKGFKPELRSIDVIESISFSHSELNQIRYIDQTTDAERNIRYNDLPQSVRPEVSGLQYEIVKSYSSADSDYYNLLIVPFDSNHIYSQIDFDIDLIASTANNIETSSSKKAVDNILQSLNQGNPVTGVELSHDSQSAGFSSEADYIIITNQKMSEQFERFALFKRSMGYTIKIMLIEDIEAQYAGIDLAEKVRNSLKAAYSDGAEWLLIGGDETIVPVRRLYAANTYGDVPYDYIHASDLYYGDLTGDWDVDGDDIWGEPSHDDPDLQPELFVGRLPARDSIEARIMIDKTIAYESGAVLTDNFAEKAMISSSDQMRDWNLGQGQDSLLAEYFPDYVNLDISSMAEAPSGSDPSPASPHAQDYIDFYSEGWNLSLVLAHGATEGFVTMAANYNEWPKSFVWAGSGGSSSHGYMDNLTNYNQAGIVYSVACSQGGFDLDQPPRNAGRCVAEEFLLLEDRGACAFIGYARYGWVASSYLLAEDFINYLYNTDNRLGPANTYSKLNHATNRDLNYGLNLFGDPSLAVWTETPQSLTVDHPQNISLGDNSFIIQVKCDGAPVDDVMITIVSESENYVLDYTNQSGRLGISFDCGQESSVILTATKSGYKPYFDTLTVSIVLDTDDDTDDPDGLPKQFTLYQNYPNPANPSTHIRFDLPAQQQVNLEVYNLLGQKVIEEDLGTRESGSHEIELNLAGYSSGVYFYRITADDNVRTKKLMLLK